MAAVGARAEELRGRVLGGSVSRALFWLAAPIMASRALGTVQEAVDTVFLGHLGRYQLAAPTAAWPLLWLFMSLVFALGTVAQALVSQLVGARRYLEASRVAGMLWGLSLIVAVAASASMVAVAPLVFSLLGIPGSVRGLSLDYVLVESVSFPLAYTMFLFSSVSSALGDTRKPFIVNALSSVINLVLDPILIFGLLGVPRMGVVGAALATGVSRIIAGGYAALLMLRGDLGVAVKPLAPNGWIVSKTLSIGGPVAAQQILVSTGFVVMSGLVAGLGAIVMAAYNVSIAVIDLIQAVDMGFSVATATLVGQSLGAGLRSRAREAAAKALGLVFASLTAGTALIVAFRSSLAGLFTGDPAVLRESERMIELFAPSIPFLGLLFTAMGVARGSGHTLAPSLLGVARLWLLRIPLTYLLAYRLGMGSTGVWIGMSISNIASGLAGAAWVLLAPWDRPVLQTHPEGGAAGEPRGLKELSREAPGTRAGKA